MASNLRNRVLLRVEGNDLIGHGHFMRCLTIARYLQTDFECVFAMSTASDWVISQLNEHNFAIINLAPQDQFHPDDPRSNEPWSFDVNDTLRPADILILDGYRFDSTFHEATKCIGAKTIRIIDALVGPIHCDAIITQLPIPHSEVQSKLGIQTAWTGLDGFLVRPEFYDTRGVANSPHYDFFIYVTNKESLNYYKRIESLKNARVVAIISPNMSIIEEGWITMSNLSSGHMVRMMKNCAHAILPASSIAIEYFVATRRRPNVFSIATNQDYGINIFVGQNFWTTSDSFRNHDGVADIKRLDSPQTAFQQWVNNFKPC